MSEEGPAILFESRAPGVTLLRFNRPARLNAFGLAMREALQASLDAAQTDPSVRAIVIAGSERAFVAGADLSAVAKATRDEMAGSTLHRIWDYLDDFAKPIVMAVRGYCLGAGCELLMHGDITVVAEDARIGQPEIKVGIQPGAGGLSRLVRLVGYHRAMLMTMTGEPVSGEDAARMGLASETVASADVEHRAIAIAEMIAALPADRIASIKQTARRGMDLALSEHIAAERQAYWSAFGSPDQIEGMAAFLEKRAPKFNAVRDVPNGSGGEE